jgi:hypothetical protein
MFAEELEWKSRTTAQVRGRGHAWGNPTAFPVPTLPPGGSRQKTLTPKLICAFSLMNVSGHRRDIWLFHFGNCRRPGEVSNVRLVFCVSASGFFCSRRYIRSEGSGYIGFCWNGMLVIHGLAGSYCSSRKNVECSVPKRCLDTSRLREQCDKEVCSTWSRLGGNTASALKNDYHNI